MQPTERAFTGRNSIGPGVERLRSSLPQDAAAVIERGPRSVTQSAPALRRPWLLRFKPRARQGIDPLTGWTRGNDPLAHLTLRFPDLASAIRYAERHDLPYEVLDDQPRRPRRRRADAPHQPVSRHCSSTREIYS